MHPERAHLAGCILVVLAGVVLSVGILCVRSASASDPWQYLLWRALAFGIVLAVVAAVRHGTSPFVQLKRLGGFAWLSVLAMTASQICFIAAITRGNTAEMFFLMSLAPLMAVVLARLLLGERIGARGMLAIAVALAGVALMSGVDASAGADRQTHSDGAWLARMLALGTAFSFALYSIATRGARQEDLDAALVGVGAATTLVSAAALLWLGLPFVSSARDTLLAAAHGGVILALGLFLFGRGSRVVPGVTLVMLAQAETVVAPIWTWLVFGETTTLAVVSGGVLILAAVMLQASDSAARRPLPAARGAAD